MYNEKKNCSFINGTTLSVAVCGYSVQAMTYGYDMGGKVFISEDSLTSNLQRKKRKNYPTGIRKKCVMNLLILNATVLILTTRAAIHCIIRENRKMAH